MQTTAGFESVTTRKQLVRDIKYGFNGSINVWGGIGNIKAAAETLCTAEAAIRVG